MLVIIAHLFMHPGQEVAFRVYETAALARFRAHGGEVLAAFRPSPTADGEPTPDEIHVLRIESEEAFALFRGDCARRALDELRAQAIRETRIFVSQEHIPYD
ncbi:MAG: hypothetical protein KF753_13750 [Caldilineaceae bacterium]|nr:hypothetical protein [Caldilineaceae bacterium]